MVSNGFLMFLLKGFLRVFKGCFNGFLRVSNGFVMFFELFFKGF